LTMKPAGWLKQKVAGHAHCYPEHETIEASPNVFVEGCRVVRKGDAVADHGGSCSKHSASHGGTVVGGSKTVLVNNRWMGRQGDMVKCATGQTAPLLQGRATVLVGDANASSTPRATPDADPSAPGRKADTCGGPKPSPSASDKARFAALRPFLSLTQKGREMLAFIDQYGVEVIFVPPGTGSCYARSAENEGGPRQIRIELGQSLVETLRTLAHEVDHFYADVTGISAVERVLTMSRDDFVYAMLREEARCIMAEIELWLQLKDLVRYGELTPSQERELTNNNQFAKLPTLWYAYSEGADEGYRELVARNPNPTREEIDRARQEGALNKMIQGVRYGRTTTTNQTPEDFYREWWDREHGQKER